MALYYSGAPMPDLSRAWLHPFKLDILADLLSKYGKVSLKETLKSSLMKFISLLVPSSIDTILLLGWEG